MSLNTQQLESHSSNCSGIVDPSCCRNRSLPCLRRYLQQTILGPYRTAPVVELATTDYMGWFAGSLTRRSNAGPVTRLDIDDEESEKRPCRSARIYAMDERLFTR